MRVLLVCESFSPKLSGGKVARYLQRILVDNGHYVEVAVTGDFDETHRPRPTGGLGLTALPHRSRGRRFYGLLDRIDVPRELKALVDRFSPDVAHFASFDHTKSSNLYDYCKSKNIRIVLQPWTMHFYCAQGFGFLVNENCSRCVDSSFLAAFNHGCATVRGVLGQLERGALQRSVVSSADVVLSSNPDLDEVLSVYGIPSEKIVRFPVAFDVDIVVRPPLHKGDYYIYYGQAVAHKGIDFVVDLFQDLPNKKLKIYPMANFSIGRPLPPNIEVLNGLSWDNGLKDAIAGSLGVLIPSLWMTSTEYSLCEAMAMGKPVIAFNVGAHKSMLADRVDAMIVHPGDRAAFVSALEELEADPILYENLSLAGTRRIAEINRPETLHAQLMTAYRQ